jgi:hypothetical protein
MGAPGLGNGSETILRFGWGMNTNTYLPSTQSLVPSPQSPAHQWRYLKITALVVVDVESSNLQLCRKFQGCKVADNSNNYQILAAHNFWFH